MILCHNRTRQSLANFTSILLSNFLAYLRVKEHFPRVYECLLCSETQGITEKCISLLSGLREGHSTWLRCAKLS